MSQDNEAKTRKSLIDPQLKVAGWDIANASQFGIEIPVDGFSADAWSQIKSNG